MKTAAILAFAALCVMQVADASLSQVQIQGQRMKNEVKNTQNAIDRTKRSARLTFDRQLHEPKIDALGAINNVVNPVINQLRADVNKAKEEGKNAEPCYESARLRLRDLSMEAQRTIDRCDNLAKITVQTEFDNMDNLKAHGNTITSDIDSAFLSCYSSNPMQMESCLTLKLSMIRPAINGFKSTADSLERDVQNTIRSAVSDARSCFNAPPEKIRGEVPSINSAAATCIANA